MSKIIIFTDTHMQPEVRDGKLNPDAQLAKGIAHVNEFNSDAELVVFCGDLTDKGDVCSYEMLKERLQDLNIPYQLLLGNHDNRENFLSVFPEANLDENGYVQHAVQTPFAKLILLDTLNGPPYVYPESHIGYLCDKRLGWLKGQLDEAGNKPCVIFMHHPPHNTGFAGMDAIKLANGYEFYKAIQEAGNVRQLICGHVHRTISGSHKNIPFAVFKSTVGQMPMTFDSFDTCLEVNEPSAYGILFVQEEGVLVQTEDFDFSTF